jgi:23S rRNA pseudouridine1911/1915/1917 synthase
MDTIINKYLVTEQDDAKRLDAYASSLNSIESRSMAQKLIKSEKILVNGNPSKEAYKVKAGDEIAVMIDPPKESHIVAEDIPLDIVYEDGDILVVNKEKGMVVHPGSGNYEGTLVNAIMSHCKDSLSGIGGELRPGIVHRIDKDTSGLLVVAKNDKAHINLSEQIKNHTVTKIYTCLVKGNVPEDKATIDMPIARSQNDRKKMDVNKDGKDAVTHITVLKRYGNYTLLSVKIDTGRTHQIRVHLSHIGYPIVGDEVYSKGKNEFDVHGQMLHSTELSFVHPTTNKEMHFEAPLPEYFKEVLSELDRRA